MRGSRRDFFLRYSDFDCISRSSLNGWKGNAWKLNVWNRFGWKDCNATKRAGNIFTWTFFAHACMQTARNMLLRIHIWICIFFFSFVPIFFYAKFALKYCVLLLHNRTKQLPKFQIFWLILHSVNLILFKYYLFLEP